MTRRSRASRARIMGTGMCALLVVALSLTAEPAWALGTRSFAVPTESSALGGITKGPDGNLWFAEYLGDQIGRITPAGEIVEFPVPTSGGNPFWVANGPDGNLWFTEVSGNQIGRITPTGEVTEFPVITPSSSPLEITAGPDGNLWFTEAKAGRIGRI